MGIKLLYAFVWQEQTFKLSFIYMPETMLLGGILVPILNGISNMLNSYTYFEQSFQVMFLLHKNPKRLFTHFFFQDGVNIYPGEQWCNRLSPHAKWHAQSAVGLLDLVYLADFINGVTKK
jgi:hypothetical protein